MYRFEDSEGHSIVYSGDTAPTDAAIRLAHGADVLVHEHSWGATRSPSSQPLPAQQRRRCRAMRPRRTSKGFVSGARAARCAEASLKAARDFPQYFSPNGRSANPL